MLIATLLVAIAVLPGQTVLAPEMARCVVGADGVAVCGFGCAEGPTGRVACAAEPGGVCAVDTDGTFRCTRPTGITIRLPFTPAACVRGADGSAACGYDCVVDGNGRARCANTPDGACIKTPSGKAVCTRLPERQRIVLLNDVVSPSCLSDRDGGVVCGYGCVEGATGRPRCATTPDGACGVDKAGVVVCTRFDPASRLYVGGPPEASCLRGARGVNACGYGCAVDSDGTARCSSTPFGICARRTNGAVRCFPEDETTTR